MSRLHVPLLCLCLTLPVGCARLGPPVAQTVPVKASDDLNRVAAHLKAEGVLGTKTDFWALGPVLAGGSYMSVVRSGDCVAFVGDAPNINGNYLVAAFEREADAIKAETSKRFTDDPDPDDDKQEKAYRKGRVVLIAPKAAAPVVAAFESYR